MERGGEGLRISTAWSITSVLRIILMRKSGQCVELTLAGTGQVHFQTKCNGLGVPAESATPVDLPPPSLALPAPCLRGAGGGTSPRSTPLGRGRVDSLPPSSSLPAPSPSVQSVEPQAAGNCRTRSGASRPQCRR